MTASFVEVVGTGLPGSNTLQISFPYIRREDVKVTVDGLPRDALSLTWVHDGAVTLPDTVGALAGKTLRAQRITPIEEPEATFGPGGLDHRDLNLTALQSLYVHQEAKDTLAQALSISRALDGRVSVVEALLEGELGTEVGNVLFLSDYVGIATVRLEEKIIFKSMAPTNHDAWDFRIWRDASQVTGGSEGLVNATLLVDLETGPSEVSFEWGGLFKLANNASGGQNVACYFQATKFGAGPTWSGCFETREPPGSPYGPLIGIENAISANGDDPSNIRVALDVIAARYDDFATLPTIYAGVRITAAWNGYSGGVESARFKRPLVIDANWTDTAIFVLKREAMAGGLTERCAILSAFVPEVGNLNELSVHFTKTGAGTSFADTTLFFDRMVDGVLFSRVAFYGDRTIGFETGGGTRAFLVDGGGFAIPMYSVNPDRPQPGQMIFIPSLNRVRILGTDENWHQFAMES